MNEVEAQRELPKYRSHKTVHALKLNAVTPVNGKVVFTPFDAAYRAITHPDSAEVVKRCRAREMGDPGYLVIYPDGFTSWSPTKAFEDGYTAI